MRYTFAAIWPKFLFLVRTPHEFGMQNVCSLAGPIVYVLISSWTNYKFGARLDSLQQQFNSVRTAEHIDTVHQHGLTAEQCRSVSCDCINSGVFRLEVTFGLTVLLLCLPCLGAGLCLWGRRATARVVHGPSKVSIAELQDSTPLDLASPTPPRRSTLASQQIALGLADSPAVYRPRSRA